MEKLAPSGRGVVADNQHRPKPRGDLGAIPIGFDGRPIMQWIDEPGTLGDPEACAALKATLAAKQNQLAQLQSTKVQLQEAAIDAALAENTEAQASIQSQLVNVNGSIWNVSSDIAQLDAEIVDCEKLSEPPPSYVEPVPPRYVPPPPPTLAPTAKKSDRSWLLLAVAAVGTAFFALSN